MTFVQTELKSLKLEPKVILFMDNCSSHQSEERLVSPDSLITANFLPPNVPSLIQPMNQGLLESLKWNYRKSLLKGLLLSDSSVQDIAAY